MKEALVSPDAKVKIVDSPIPKPNADQVLIKVVCSGTNPKDWKHPMWTKQSLNAGDDIAGIIEQVGENITEFKPGDRVAAFHEIEAPHGSFAEYAIAWGHTTFHLPKKTSFEEAATIPLAAMTAVYGLYDSLGLPQPWHPATEPLPLIVYGASSAVGAFAVKLARLSNIHPIIAVAGHGQSFVETLIDRSSGDTIVDYRKGAESLITGIKDAVKAAGANEVKYALDAVSDHGSYENLFKVLAPGGTFTLVLPNIDTSGFPSNLTFRPTMVGDAHLPIPEDHKKLRIETGKKDLAFVYFRFFTRALQQGWLKAHPYEVLPGGLNAIETGLANLKSGKNSASKYVYRIAETK
ncbi:MAG: hypothetical protein M1818_008203 [Claussenomyces sp. TS43310]|nr:MAG: hypothetical protein M1818_008203 [Claussenomyces sp. TS43310]